ncbi:MAG: outer membrane beta-barrel protein [Chitinophagaceae bacterium]|nr:outer membrane beta-barrel protein [Chitinophagaceae bacterium]MCW5913606.1 outer membrane beta-barrel protein [Chitinophagaceae bacterium]MCZ2395646.1 porin family protein [Chitinophagales bacterium]
MKYFLAVCLAMATFSVNAQRLWADGFVGALNYQGDLQDKRFTFSQSHLSGGAGVTYDFSDHFGARLHLLFGALSADDKNGRNAARNLNFKTSMFEVQAALKYYIMPLNSHLLTPYVFAGIGVFHFNPYTYDTTNVKYFLRPLSTEGQGFLPGTKQYALTQFSIPAGFGVKLSLTDNLNVGLEMGLRKTFTDYIDDVSTTYVDEFLLLSERGPKAVELAYRGGELPGGGPYPAGGDLRGGARSLDWYYFTGLTVSFRIDAGASRAAGFDSKSFACPPKM